MSVRYKQLAQQLLSTTLATQIYAQNSGEISQFFLKAVNHSNSPVFVAVYHDELGATFDNSTMIGAATLGQYEFLEEDHIFTDDSNAVIAVSASVANAITVTIYGVIKDE